MRANQTHFETKVIATNINSLMDHRLCEGIPVIHPSLFYTCPSLFYMCPSLFYMCPSLFYTCPSLFYACPSLFYTCPSLFYMCPSLFYTCPSLFYTYPSLFYICPSLFYTCPSLFYTCPSLFYTCPSKRDNFNVVRRLGYLEILFGIVFKNFIVYSIEEISDFRLRCGCFPGKFKLIFREFKIGQPTKIKYFLCLTNH
jgi:hypothetical protein